jgi:hypothetical protein
MSAQQTSYALELGTTGYAGQLADTRDHVSDARRNDLAASAEAVYGRLYCRSTNADLLGFGLADATHQTLGVLAHSMDLEEATTGLLNGEFGNLVHKGRVYVTVVDSVTPDSLVRVYGADYSGSVSGAVEGTFGATKHASYTCLLTNARYLGSASAGETVILEIDALPTLLTLES